MRQPDGDRKKRRASAHRYNQKFSEFFEMLDYCKASGVPTVWIPTAQTLADTYGEGIESLTLNAAPELGLRIVSE